MRNKIEKPLVLCEDLRKGIAELAHAAGTVYGTGRQVQYQTSPGVYSAAASFSELLQQAAFSECHLARAASVLRGAALPGDGVKTALILLDALLERGIGLPDADWRQVSDMLAYGVEYTKRAAAENDGKVVGGGLMLLTLCRPILKYGRDHRCEQSANILAYALTQPMLRLAEAAGFDGYEVYERVKTLAPNQFFSLHQVGIERSIRVDAAHTDEVSVGLNIREGKIQNLKEQALLEPVETTQEILRFTDHALTDLLNIACII